MVFVTFGRLLDLGTAHRSGGRYSADSERGLDEAIPRYVAILINRRCHQPISSGTCEALVARLQARDEETLWHACVPVTSDTKEKYQHANDRTIFNSSLTAAQQAQCTSCSYNPRALKKRAMRCRIKQNTAVIGHDQNQQSAVIRMMPGTCSRYACQMVGLSADGWGS